MCERCELLQQKIEANAALLEEIGNCVIFGSLVKANDRLKSKKARLRCGTNEQVNPVQKPTINNSPASG